MSVKTFRQLVENINELPAMPRVAQELLLLRSNIDANASDLARIIKMDPSLSAQVVRYANSPLYRYQGEIRNIQDAIARVLGHEVVMDMAIGVSLGRTLQMPDSGPLGLSGYWQNAVYTAVLTQRLGKLMEPVKQPQAGLAYLCGLLHNFGFLVLGHMFRNQFNVLGKAVMSNPDVPVDDVEKHVLGMTHMEIGEWILAAWQLPVEVLTAVREHHMPDYDGEYYKYANLVLLADRLQGSYDTISRMRQKIPDAVIERLGLDVEKVMKVFADTREERTAMDTLAVQMAA